MWQTLRVFLGDRKGINLIDVMPLKMCHIYSI